MTLTNCLIALGVIVVCVDIWYTRKWLRVSKMQLEELQAFARKQLDRGPKP